MGDQEQKVAGHVTIDMLVVEAIGDGCWRFNQCKNVLTSTPNLLAKLGTEIAWTGSGCQVNVYVGPVTVKNQV